MGRFVIPLILIAAGVGLFFVYTDPTYKEAKGIATEVKAYDDALSKSKDIRKRRDDLMHKRDAFAPDDVKKLEELLPDNVDNIRLVIDINNIAARRQLSLKGVNLGTISDSRSTSNALSIGKSGDAVGSVEVGFTVTATYDTMLQFVADLEHSLRLIDIQKMSFSVTDGGSTDYTFSIRTYWLH